MEERMETLVVFVKRLYFSLMPFFPFLRQTQGPNQHVDPSTDASGRHASLLRGQPADRWRFGPRGYQRTTPIGGPSSTGRSPTLAAARPRKGKYLLSQWKPTPARTPSTRPTTTTSPWVSSSTTPSILRSPPGKPCSSSEQPTPTTSTTNLCSVLGFVVPTGHAGSIFLLKTKGKTISFICKYQRVIESMMCSRQAVTL